MEYNIYGEVRFNVDFDIEAVNEEEAVKLAEEQIKDYYHLDVVNAYHDSGKVKINIDAGEYED
jgi:hypothetical protein